MTASPQYAKKDLVALTADANMAQAMSGLLARSASLEIRPLTFDVLVHPQRDPGCLRRAGDILRPLVHLYDHAMVLFDHEGCGQENVAAIELANRLRNELENMGWRDSAEAIVFEPELEQWVWTNSPHVARVLGWANREPDLRAWLHDHGHWPDEAPKPPRPKEAMEAALFFARIPRSSALYRELANNVSLQSRSDPWFLRFSGTLRRWFSV
jgi:hypothetical protein